MRKCVKCLIWAACVLCLLMNCPIQSRADMGPKPEINITVENCKGRVYVTLLASVGGPSPVSTGMRDSVPEEVMQAFADYSDREGLRFVEDAWIIDENSKQLYCGYRPPESFKVVVYMPDSGEFMESNIYERFAYEGYYSLDLSERDVSGKLVLHENVIKATGVSWAVPFRMIITILIELGVAWLFGIKKRFALGTVSIVNFVTQIILNVVLAICVYRYGAGIMYLIRYLEMEVLIVILEYLIYSKCITDDDVSKKLIGGYTVVANLASWIGGPVLVMIGTICYQLANSFF